VATKASETKVFIEKLFLLKEFLKMFRKESEVSKK
jgi:hypothetical protein